VTVLVEHVARILFPAALAVAVALWVRGYAAAGDGFSAGLLAALGATVQYLAHGRAAAARTTGAPYATRIALAGLALTLAVALAPVLAGLAPVTHFPGPDAHVVKLGALELHTATLFDLGVGLVVYGFVVATMERLLGSDPEPEDEP
jgi:multisubunit Na+/H+ antiporter MnhB subunit